MTQAASLRPGTNPLVSVVIPSYNHARFIERAIRSVLAQTYRPLELVVVDDGSSDGTADIARDSLKASAQVDVHFEEQQNVGAHAAINRGLALAKGDILTILNSDDAYHPARLEQLVPHVFTSPMSTVFSSIDLIDQDDRPLDTDHAWPKWYRAALEATEALPTTGLRVLCENISVTSGNLVFSRQLLESVGGFAPFRFAHDLDFLLRSVYYGEPVFDQSRLLFYRIHETNTTENVRQLLEQELTEIFGRYLALFDSGPSPNCLAPHLDNWPRYLPHLERTQRDRTGYPALQRLCAAGLGQASAGSTAAS